MVFKVRSNPSCYMIYVIHNWKWLQETIQTSMGCSNGSSDWRTSTQPNSHLLSELKFCSLQIRMFSDCYMVIVVLAFLDVFMMLFLMSCIFFYFRAVLKKLPINATSAGRMLPFITVLLEAFLLFSQTTALVCWCWNEFNSGLMCFCLFVWWLQLQDKPLAGNKTQTFYNRCT